MATFDQLPADQRAIIELVLQRGQSYGDLSGMLGMPAPRVKDLAREALSQLSPRTYERVDAQWRGQLADYLLGQQTGPEATATRGHLKSSEPARAWANSLLDALDPLYPDAARPEIPEAGSADPPVRRGRRERTERAERREPAHPSARAEAPARP
nr:sigma-70 family RNA polymerase sigma factor [Thermoleophilaceae bacterium]